MKKNNKQIPDITLERYILEELPENMMREITHLLQHDILLKERCEALNASNEELLSRFPANIMVNAINNRITESGKKNDNHKVSKIKSILPPVLGLATAALILILIFPLWNNETITTPLNTDIFDTDINEGIRLKGKSAQLYIYRKKGQQVELLKNGSIAEKSDLLQLAYRSEDKKYGIIFSIDGRGVVTLHYPNDNYSSAKLQSKRKVLINKSYELDDAPQFERFFFVTSQNNFDINEVLKQAYLVSYNNRRILNEDLKLDKKFSQYSIIIMKR